MATEGDRGRLRTCAGGGQRCEQAALAWTTAEHRTYAACTHFGSGICANFPPDAGSRGIPTNRTGADLHSHYSDEIFESEEVLRIARDEG
jgi:hypothetical protein